MSALDDFHLRVREVEGLLDLVAPGWSPGRAEAGQVPPSTIFVGVLSRSSIILLVSYFEGFLKDLTDEAFDQILVGEVPCERLPAHLRGQAVMSHVRILRGSSDASVIWQAVSDLTVIGRSLAGGSAVTADLLPREETKREVTSIEPQKINMLLRVLNDHDLNRGPMSRHGQKLRGLKQLRDNAVHGNEQDLPPLGYADIVQTVTSLSECAKDLSAHVTELVQAL